MDEKKEITPENCRFRVTTKPRAEGTLGNENICAPSFGSQGGFSSTLVCLKQGDGQYAHLCPLEQALKADEFFRERKLAELDKSLARLKDLGYID